MPLEAGTLINNRYRILEILGKGGMGAVYRAMDENLGLEVALKENLFTSEEYSRQFWREATILANLRHPNLPRVTDHFVIENQGQYLVMDYIEGEDLRQQMDRLGVLSEEEIVKVGVAICNALQYLDTRTQPIVHRDIKPGNVKITQTGQIFLVDFGLAKIVETDQMTTGGARAMTPGYSPPEQYGTSRTDHRSDLYSLGATLYAAITGSLPEDALARAMGQIELTPVRKRNPKVSPELASVLEKALAIRPDDRFHNAQDFKQALLGKYPLQDEKIQSRSSQAALGQSNANPNEPGFVLGKGIDEASLPSLGLSEVQAELYPAQFWRNPYITKGILLLGSIVILIVLIYFVWNSRQNQSGQMPFSTPTLASAINLRSTYITSPTVTSFAQDSPTGTSQVIQKPFNPTSSPGANVASPIVTVQPTPIGGGGGEIVFASDRSGIVQLWVIHLDGSNLRQVTDMPEGACQPAWSPDGMRLIFVSPCNGNDEIYPGSGLFIINYDGSNLTPLPSLPGGDFNPAWSPDGQYIAFSSVRVSDRPRLYLMDFATNTPIRLSGQYSHDMQPAWSFDGKRIAYVSRQEGPSDIWVMNQDGSNQIPFTHSGFKMNSYPAWSLDENVILFTQTDKPGGVPRLTTASKIEGVYHEYPLNLGPIPSREAKYSPDGLWIVFESWPDGKNHDIYISSASGAGRIRLTDFPSVEFDPAWRPQILNP